MLDLPCCYGDLHNIQWIFHSQYLSDSENLRDMVVALLEFDSRTRLGWVTLCARSRTRFAVNPMEPPTQKLQIKFGVRDHRLSYSPSRALILSVWKDMSYTSFSLHTLPKRVSCGARYCAWPIRPSSATSEILTPPDPRNVGAGIQLGRFEPR